MPELSAGLKTCASGWISRNAGVEEADKGALGRATGVTELGLRVRDLSGFQPCVLSAGFAVLPGLENTIAQFKYAANCMLDSFP
jgi:hypothetical protein